MTSQQLSKVVDAAHGRESDGGWHDLVEHTLTLHLASGGASISLSRIRRVQADGDMVRAEAAHGQVHLVRLEDIFAATAQPSRSAERKAGFV